MNGERPTDWDDDVRTPTFDDAEDCGFTAEALEAAARSAAVRAMAEAVGIARPEEPKGERDDSECSES